MVSNMTTGRNRHRRAIGTFPNRRAAEQALHELRDSGYPMEQVSVVAQDSTRNDNIAGASKRDHTDNKADDGAKVGALSGGALGGLTGLLVGLGALAIPGIGPIMLAGAAATALATTVAGGAIGAAAGSLLGGLIGLGVPEERAKVYNNRVSAGEYLVLIDGTDAEIARAEALLHHRGIEEWGVYDIPATTTTQQSTASVMPAATVPPAVATEEAVRKFEERRIVPPNNEQSRPTAPVPSAPIAPPDRVARAVEQPVVNANTEDIKLYEERLVANKEREKVGEVAIDKRVEVETARAAVPIEKERVVIERTPVSDATATSAGTDAFHEDVVRMDVYEETPDIHKEAFVREEVTLRKEIAQETVNAEETLRREELSIDTQGHPAVENRLDHRRVDRT